MKFFLDSACIEEVQEAAATGLISGVTTNPSLIAAQGKSLASFYTLIQKICEVVQGPVSAEVTATDTTGMIQEGKTLSSLSPHVVVKVPLTPQGLEACTFLQKKSIPVNVTLCFSPLQTLLAAKAGATYISPFVGRLEDHGENGEALLKDTRALYDRYGFKKTSILAASLRHPEHVLMAAKCGADVATFPFKVFKQLSHHPLTQLGLERFLEDWKKIS